MDPIINPGSRKPMVNVDAKANLDIKLEGWQGTTAIGLIGMAFVAIFGLFFKYRS